MWIRLRLDIGWRDLAYGAAATAAPLGRDRLAAKAEDWWTRSREGVVCLSVRSGWDLLLQALDLPRGSEVLFSALNVPDMPRIAKLHGLVPIPIDMEPDGSVLSVERLRESIRPETRLLVVAHLFGAHTPMDRIVQLAREHSIMVVEDCAQAYRGQGYEGDVRTDASMFSFGPIKTASALGGAAICLRDPAIAGRMRDIQSRYPLQTRLAYGKRLAKYALFKILTARPIFGPIIRSCRYLGRSADSMVSGAARNFPGDDFLGQLRRRPSTGLLALLLRRWNRYPADRLVCRTQLGNAFEKMLFGSRFDNRSETPAGTAVRRNWDENSFWVFPVLCDEPKALAERLLSAGFDATGQTRLAIVAAPPHRSDCSTDEVQRLIDHLLLVPLYPELPDRQMRRMTKILRGHVRPVDVAVHRPVPCEVELPAT